MSLTPGTRLGPYEILSPLGAGGMGEVYRARDTRLGRDVAIKVLPQHLSSSPEVRARFEREARAVSSLNHPHICTLHDVGREGDVDYLVMELVEGETLLDRLLRGALPPADLLRLGTQIADALDRAHRAGIVHRDLKPGNVMLTKTGAKLMDFGLARATGMAGSGGASGGTIAALSQSPTAARPLTAEGTIVGTFQYMSPEQLEGKEADPRSDLWALGCVLYEMATGRRAFEGKSQASLIGAIMNTEPAPISAVAPMAPPALDRLVRRCLAKDPDDRWQSARDVVHELQWIGEAGSHAGAPVPSGSTAGATAITATLARQPRALLAWAILATAALAAALVTTALRGRSGSEAASSPTEFTLEPPSGYTFSLPGDPALSPDGSTVACVVQDSAGTTKLAIRPLDRAEIRVLPATDDASLPFWSPDGHSIGFFSKGKLRKLGLDGSSPLALADATDGRGGSWSHDGTIVFVPTASGCVYTVPASGGNAVQITTLDSGRDEVGHRYPCLLQDGRHFLYVAFGKKGKHWLCVGNADGGPSRVLRETEMAARWAGPGWILTVERRRVLAQRLDERALELSGSPIEIAECGGMRKIGHANLAAAANGTLVYQRAWQQRSCFRWYDASGVPVGARTREFESPLNMALAPDQRRVAITLAADNDLWLLDLEHPVPSRLTFFNVAQYSGLYSPVWSPDSKRIAYSLRSGASSDVIHVISAETAADTVLFAAPGLFAQPVSWSTDGRRLIAMCSDSQGGFDIWTVPVEDPSAAARYLQTPDYENSGALSPDGHWFACLTFVADEWQVRIYSIPAPGSRYQIVLDWKLANNTPAWSADGRTLILVDSKQRVIAVPVQLEGGFRQGEPRVLFGLPPRGSLVAAAPDLYRFLVSEAEPLSNPAPLCVLTSWRERLVKR
jgi:hypothetical protein